MIKIENLGKIIQELRTSANISRRKLAIMLDCTEMTIKRIEEGTTKISDYMIVQINTIFDINIYEYYGIISRYNSYSTYINCKKLKTAIDLHDIDTINNCVVEFENLNDFTKNEPFLILSYAKIVTCIDLAESIKLCYLSLQITNLEEALELLDNIKLNDNVYSILIALNANLELTNLLEESFLLSEKLYKHFKNIIFDNDIRLEKYNFDIQKKYIAIINNFSHNCFINSDYEKSLLLADEGVSLCLYFNTLHGIEYLYLLKMEANYFLGNINESLKYKNYFIVFCETKQNLTLLNKIKDKIKKLYPELNL